MTTTTRLRVENRPVSPTVLGLGDPSPRLSWQVTDAPDGWAQAGYAVEIERDGAATVHEAESAEQLFVAWPEAPLTSRERVVVRVRAQGADGEWVAWSEPVAVEAGLLETTDWKASFISPATLGGILTPAPLLTTEWDLPSEIVSARLHVTAHGLYEMSLNGERVGDEYLAPGWTTYTHRLRYQTHDVTGLLREGANDVSALLGNGWFRGRLTWGNRRALYGDRLSLLAQLEVVTADGTRHILGTDDTWRAHTWRVLADDIYDGCTTDLRITEPQGDDAVEIVDADLSLLVAPDGPPVRVTEVVAAQKTWRSPSGALLIDFGQNVVGWVRLIVRAESGREVTVTQAEVLEHDELGIRPLRTAKATDTYYLAGTGDEVLEPTFTFHGFRYARIDGVDEAEIVSAEAVVIHSDMERTGWFDSSHELLNRLHENVVWGMRGNFVDVPTDCPQRDERLGWTGDIQVFTPTAEFLYDSTGFLRSWLRDLEADQFDDGGVPIVVPNVLGAMVATAWGDAAAIVPTVLHERTGDEAVLARQLPSMRRWVEFLDNAAGEDGVWSGGFQFGDWLDPTAPPEEPARAKADPDVVATAHVYRSADFTARAAAIVGDADIEAYARSVADRALAGFRREFVTPGGRILSDAQTVYAMALVFDLLENDAQREAAASRLADLVRISGFRISTGFVGTPLVTDALADNGHVETAYRLLLQTGCPSWLYPVTMGATTIWERWDSMLPDGTINPGEMTSFNHYALGAVADWLHRTVAGLAPAAPGYRRIRIAPRPGGGLTHASARHLSPFGEIAVGWKREGDEVVVSATIPPGVTAEVELPGVAVEVGSGTHEWRVRSPEPAYGPPATVRDLMDDPARWDRFVEGTIAAPLRGMVHFTDEASVADRMAAHLDDRVEVLVDAFTLGGSDDGRDEILAVVRESLT
ncbi:family 78 glycoside hydrolase catalytic domain [Tessaracoccus sp. MC1679]|uniref:glycoside hydrolase family 78 protein n=1 Tax=Tessaracoccus sp. MC1679 TaxID=2760313 RepID=UPI0016048340|nr:glycoside hydrolase family 78 protein [Tessaracoccus sp. MC1679]MBB1514440.1 family 78 glycoside hydrolase catalytic domain [Tessaracoccus sp. MC1679]